MDASVGGSRGYYYLLEDGFLKMTDESQLGGAPDFWLSFAPGMDALGVLDDNRELLATYARSAPSAINGDDNVPSVSDGTCSMVGTWAVPGNDRTPSVPPAWLTFDEQGRFSGGPLFDNGCPSHMMYGTYRLTPATFQLTSNVGMGLCSWWFTAAYEASFDGDCSHLTTTVFNDQCTGGRGYLNGTVTMTRVR
jgi:hypothetical protein